MEFFERRVPFFCDPYPGELFYSAVARFFHYTPFLTLSQKYELLFGKKVSNQLLLVRGADELQKALGPFYTLERILQDYTVWPYFAPFLTSGHQKRLMATARIFGPPFESSLDLKTHSIVLNRPRYCPDCVKEDVKAYGEAYFHTFHHLPGVDICPRHHLYLIDYPGSFTRYTYNYLDETLTKETSGRCEDEFEIRLAHLAASALELDCRGVCLEHSTGRLKWFFEQADCFKNNRICHEKLYRKLLDFYPVDFLERHGLLVEDLSKKSCWFKKCFLSERTGSPFHYLVLIAMFSDSLSEFLFSDQGKAEHTCQNPFCPNYRTSRAVKERPSEKGQVVVICDCNMIYTVSGEDPKNLRILQYGNLWLEKVKQLRAEGKTINGLAKELGVGRYFLRGSLDKESLQPITDRVLDCRRQLLEKLEADPQITRTELLETMGAPYRYLRKYDWSWLDSLVTEKRAGNTEVKNNWNIDYEKRDELYVERIRQTVKKLQSQNPQAKINRMEISLEIFGTKNFGQLDKLPKTRELLKQLTQ